MFLEVKRARLEVELEAKNVPHAIREDEIPAQADGIGDELDDIGRDADGRIPERKEHIYPRADGAENQADNPRSDRVGRIVYIEVSDGRADLARRSG